MIFAQTLLLRAPLPTDGDFIPNATNIALTEFEPLTFHGHYIFDLAILTLGLTTVVVSHAS